MESLTRLFAPHIVAQLAMQNTSTLRRRLSSAMTPDALKLINDPQSPEARREAKRPPKKDRAIEDWQKVRAKARDKATTLRSRAK